MAIPHDEVIQIHLLKLLANAPGGTLHCNEVYPLLAARFPELTPDEVGDPYSHSLSKWANRVQWARCHVVEKGFLLRPYVQNDRGFWTISEKGRQYLAELSSIATRLLKELQTS